MAALTAAGMLGVASAEAPTAPAPSTVSVEGVANEPIGQGSNAASATAVYRQGMADAISDGLVKAQFLASKTGATVGAVQSIVEGGGYIGCTSTGSEDVEYEGEQPDFGSPTVTLAAGRVMATAAPTSAPAVRHVARKRSSHKKSTAKKAVAGTCTLSTQVSLTYALS
jgi:uncharacterized protein YggE